MHKLFLLCLVPLLFLSGCTAGGTAPSAPVGSEVGMPGPRQQGLVGH